MKTTTSVLSFCLATALSALLPATAQIALGQHLISSALAHPD